MAYEELKIGASDEVVGVLAKLEALESELSAHQGDRAKRGTGMFPSAAYVAESNRLDIAIASCRAEYARLVGLDADVGEGD